MAAGTLPAPGKIIDGEEIGPCREDCEHKECAETRRMAATDCHYCLRPIGYDTPFFNHDVTGDGDRRLVHAQCLSAMLRQGSLDGESTAPQLRCRCGGLWAICPECHAPYQHGTASHCTEPGCIKVNAPLDCVKCHKVLAESRDGVLDHDGKLIPYKLLV